MTNQSNLFVIYMTSNISKPGVQNTKHVLQRKLITILLSTLVDNNPTYTRNWNVNLLVPFTPDELIVRQISYNSQENPNNHMYMLFSNLVDDQILGIFPSTNTTTNVDNHFIMKRNVNSTYSFQLQRNNDVGVVVGPGILADTAQGVVGVLLEFVQYA
jgi:hypothetical protein